LFKTKTTHKAAAFPSAVKDIGQEVISELDVGNPSFGSRSVSGDLRVVVGDLCPATGTGAQISANGDEGPT
jgi:hypothetical protein